MGKIKVTDLKTERIPIMLTKMDVGKIDDWRFANRVGSRSKAIRLLIENGLEASAKENDGEAATSTVVENTFTHEVK